MSRWSPKSLWLSRSVATRIAVPVAVGVAALLLVLAVLTRGLLQSLMIDGADETLRSTVDSAAAAVSRGAEPLAANGISVRVADTAGAAVDAAPRIELSAEQVRTLKSGVAVLTDSAPPTRWVGAVVATPDGTPRLVLASSVLASYDSTIRAATRWLIAAALVGGIVAGLLTLCAVRLAWRPVRDIRAAAEKLPVGQRLPVPIPRDELRGLAEALNAVLARRDEASARLQRFTGDAAHELRSPVAAIRAQAEVAVVHPDPATAQEVLADIVADAERLSVLVSDLLVLARSDAGELPPVQAVDLPIAVSAAIERMTPVAAAVRFDAPSGRCSVAASPAEVKVVLDNLLRNAGRYAQARITVTAIPVGSTVRLVVDDDGPGVAPEHRDKVFDRFYRAGDDRGRDSGGAGLGLALVAELVRRRRGTVRVGESPEGGARFEVRWPVGVRE